MISMPAPVENITGNNDSDDLSKAGLTGVAVSLVNYIDELPFFCDEVLPRLQRAGLREKR